MRIRNDGHFDLLLRSSNVIVRLICFRWSVEKLTGVSRDQRHHFYTKLLETSRKF
jgi:hypothetical protein